MQTLTLNNLPYKTMMALQASETEDEAMAAFCKYHPINKEKTSVIYLPIWRQVKAMQQAVKECQALPLFDEAKLRIYQTTEGFKKYHTELYERVEVGPGEFAYRERK